MPVEVIMDQVRVPLAASHQEAPPFSSAEDETKLIFSRFFDILFPAAIIFGGIALVFSIYRSVHHGWYHIMLLHIAMYLFALVVLIFRRRIPSHLKFSFMLVLMSVSVIQSLYSMGLAGEGMLTLTVVCIFSWVFLGISAGIIAMAFGVMVLSVMGVLICTGIISTDPDILNYLSEPLTWAVQIALMLLYLVPLLLIINYMRKRMIDSLVLSRETNVRLETEIKTRVAAEKELRESEEKYRGVVENSFIAFYIVQDRRFRFVNARFCEITGYSCDEIIDNMGPLDLMHGDDKENIKRIIRDYLAGKETENEYEVKVTKKDGTIITVKVFKSSIIYKGKPAYFGSAIDVTREKILEAKLIQAQKMEALGTLTGGIAHDFNNILTALTGYGTILQMKLEEADPLKKYADNIISASEKATNLIKSLLAFSRLQPVAPKPVNINNVVQGTEKLLKRLITEDITLETDLAPLNINILADNTQVDQILFNLVANARDAMPGGGILKIATKITELGEEFILNNGFGKTGRYAHITVSDNGIGMEENVKERIFEPFYTTKEPGKGTGLGLSTVYGIVKQNCGYITVRSDPGTGTEFDIYFPLIEEGLFETEKIRWNFRDGQETILVAEDNYEARCLIKDILEEYGYRIIEAEDGDDAIEKIKHHKEISLIILDSIMPKKNGKQVYEYIKRTRSEMRTLFMSGYEKDIVLEKGIIEPGFAFITKPFSPDEILKKVGELMEKQKK